MIASNERTLPPFLHATTSPPGTPDNRNATLPLKERVQATNFFLYYSFEEQGRTATTQEYDLASKRTLAYLDSFLQTAFSRHDQIHYDGQEGHVLGVTTDPVSIAFSYQVFFLEAPDLHPKQGDIDRLVSMALSEPANHVLLERLSELDPSNPFSETTAVVYSVNFNEKHASQEFQVPASAIALLVIGILLGMLGLAMILMRRRRFHRRVTTQNEETNDLVTNEHLTTLSDSEPALLSSSGSEWIDTKWSLPSGHVTCGPAMSAIEAQEKLGIETTQ